MSAVSRRPGQAGNNYGVLITVLAGVGVLGVATTALHLGNQLNGGRQNLPGHPIALVAGLMKGQVTWPAAATWLLAGLVAVLVVLVVAVVVACGKVGKRKSREDPANRHMAKPKDLTGLTRKGATATAQRLGVDSPGLPIARTLGGAQLYSSWEDVVVDIWGPRTGKTTSRAIPAILAALGPVMTTSNKRDSVDATRDVRAGTGQVWVFDPQAIAGEEPTWWWNPLTYVTDEVKARSMAKILTDGQRKPGATGDDYFAPAAINLLGDLLYAAALADKPITQVYLWLTDSTETDPADILDAHGQTLNAANVHSVLRLPYKQRDGIFDGAKQTMSFLVNQKAQRWVTAAHGPRRPQFDPAAFVTSTDTLYSLSKEGEGTTAPLVLLLTVAVLEAAETVAAQSAKGRLPVPLVAVLDEAANVVRWQSLPNLYSHFGSRGITVLTILQSWSQGVDVWGQEGMRKLWSAANVRVYGGGVAEPAFLSDLAQLVGRYNQVNISSSHGRGQRSTSRSVSRELTMDVSDLADLSKGRAVVFSSGHRAALVRTVPWMVGPHADAVAASIAAHDPHGQTTLATAYRDLAQVQAGDHDVPSVTDLQATNPWVRT